MNAKPFVLLGFLFALSAEAATCRHPRQSEAILPSHESASIQVAKVQLKMKKSPQELFSCFKKKPLEKWFQGRKLDFVQGVTGTVGLIDEFGTLGSRRLVCLEGKDSILEEVTGVSERAQEVVFNYRIWDNTQLTAKALKFELADGEFQFLDKGDHTLVTWTYRLGFYKEISGQGAFTQKVHRPYMWDGIKKFKQLCD